jgi:hypothetical protein
LPLRCSAPRQRPRGQPPPTTGGVCPRPAPLPASAKPAAARRPAKVKDKTAPAPPVGGAPLSGPSVLSLCPSGSARAGNSRRKGQPVRPVAQAASPPVGAKPVPDVALYPRGVYRFVRGENPFHIHNHNKATAQPSQRQRQKRAAWRPRKVAIALLGTI